MATMYPGIPEFEVTLPIGFTDDHGRVHRHGAVRKMTGNEEHLIIGESETLSDAQLVTKVIAACLTRLGGLQTITDEIASQMYSADRNYLLLAIWGFTSDNQLRVLYQCPHCVSTLMAIEDLSRITVRRLGENETLSDIVIELDDGYFDKRDNTIHREVVISPPRGIDEEFVSPMVSRDRLKADDALVLRTIRRFGTLRKEALEAYGVKILRDLTIGDRRKIRDVLNNQLPGVDCRRYMTCGVCGEAFESELKIADFFELCREVQQDCVKKFSTSLTTCTGLGKTSWR